MPIRIEPFSPAQIEAIAQILGDTYSGLTGSEIGRLLTQCNIEDPLEGETKWRRLAGALGTRQNRDRAGNCVVHFIKMAVNPVRFVNQPDAYESIRSDLNEVLSFSGLILADDGSMRRRRPASTLSEAAARTKRLRDEMLRRGVHGQVLRFCHAELMQQDCFDAVFEATKGLAERIREQTQLTEDGSALVDLVFSMGRTGVPMWAFNSLRSQSERSEQVGLASLMKGVFGTFRNPPAHTPKIKWHVSEADALDLLSTLSLIHRRLDTAVLVPPVEAGTSTRQPAPS